MGSGAQMMADIERLYQEMKSLFAILSQGLTSWHTGSLSFSFSFIVAALITSLCMRALGGRNFRWAYRLYGGRSSGIAHGTVIAASFDFFFLPFLTDDGLTLVAWLWSAAPPFGFLEVAALPPPDLAPAALSPAFLELFPLGTAAVSPFAVLGAPDYIDTFLSEIVYC